jgi:hypothetical protein
MMILAIIAAAAVRTEAAGQFQMRIINLEISGTARSPLL